MQTEEEPRTAITAKVEKAVKVAEEQRNRRWHDQFFNNVVKPLITPTIIGLASSTVIIITSVLWMWVDIQNLKFEMDQVQKRSVVIMEKDNKVDRLLESIEQLTAELKRQQFGVGKR